MAFQYRHKGRYRQLVDIDEEMKDDILRFAAEQKVSPSEAVRILVQRGLETKESAR